MDDRIHQYVIKSFLNSVTSNEKFKIYFPAYVSLVSANPFVSAKPLISRRKRIDRHFNASEDFGKDTSTNWHHQLSVHSCVIVANGAVTLVVNLQHVSSPPLMD